MRRRPSGCRAPARSRPVRRAPFPRLYKRIRPRCHAPHPSPPSTPQSREAGARSRRLPPPSHLSKHGADDRKPHSPEAAANSPGQSFRRREHCSSISGQGRPDRSSIQAARGGDHARIVAFRKDNAPPRRSRTVLELVEKWMHSVAQASACESINPPGTGRKVSAPPRCRTPL